jgi:NADH-quinone oxidoreductase subunit J
MPSPFFYIFAAMMLSGGLMVIFMRNPVSSALSMVLSFLGLAGIFIGLNAYFVGILQILVYAGAIMVLFIFIIMLLDVKDEESHPRKGLAITAGVLIPVALIIQLAGVILTDDKSPSAPPLTLEAAAADYKQESVIHKKLSNGSLPDVHLIGRKLFTEYNFPLQVIAVLLLVATVGCVALSKKSSAPKDGAKPDKG